MEVSEGKRRPNRYVISADRGYSDPTFKFRQLDSIRNQLKARCPHFKAKVRSTPVGDDYRYTITLNNVDDLDERTLTAITASLAAQGIPVIFEVDER